jgi:hypothetical protein
LESLGLQATFYESKGMRKGEKETLRSARGSGTIKMPYSSRRAIVIARRCSKAKGISSDWKNGGQNSDLSYREHTEPLKVRVVGI